MAVQPGWIKNIDKTTPWDSGKNPNSAAVDYPASAALADLMDTVENWITGHGWTLHDASAGANARAYKAANKDAASYKYIVLDYNTSNRIMIKTYETWNEVSHSGSNLAYSSDNSSYCQQVNLSAGGTLNIFATARYLLMESNNSGVIGSATGSAWCGCLEITRDNPEDTAALGYPCWGWANGNVVHAGTINQFSFCRTRNGTIGANAAYYSYAGTIFGSGMGNNNWSLYTATPNALNLWNSKNWALTLRVGWYYSTSLLYEYRGRLYGLKLITRGQGGFLDEISVKTNSDYFFDPNGAATGHWILTEGGQSGRFAVPK